VEELKPVIARPGRPLYEAVRDAVVTAIESGHFLPGERMPNTKELSRQMSVSLVTAHRALQELVNEGLLDRKQGRGTFVVDPANRVVAKHRVGLIFAREASMADFYHGQIVEGVSLAARDRSYDVTMANYQGSLPADCDGYVLVNPVAKDLEIMHDQIGAAPCVVTGAHSHLPQVPAVKIDNAQVASIGVRHLYGLGHRRIGLLVGAQEFSDDLSRMRGYRETCQSLGIVDQSVAFEAYSWRLHSQRLDAFIQWLQSETRPTALLAGGFYLAIDAYQAASQAGLSIPDDLSVVGVDDPPSAPHVSPPLTTVRQPLVEMGQAALHAIADRITPEPSKRPALRLRPQLMVRASSQLLKQ